MKKFFAAVIAMALSLCLVACGSDALCELKLDADEGGTTTGALVYLVDGTDLVFFHASLVPQDNMFGCSLTALELL